MRHLIAWGALFGLAQITFLLFSLELYVAAVAVGLITAACSLALFGQLNFQPSQAVKERLTATLKARGYTDLSYPPGTKAKLAAWLKGSCLDEDFHFSIKDAWSLSYDDYDVLWGRYVHSGKGIGADIFYAVSIRSPAKWKHFVPANIESEIRSRTGGKIEYREDAVIGSFDLDVDRRRPPSARVLRELVVLVEEFADTCTGQERLHAAISTHPGTRVSDATPKVTETKPAVGNTDEEATPDVPIGAIFSLLTIVNSVFIVVGLGFSWYASRFAWPGLLKSLVCIAVACAGFAHFVVRGRHDVRLLQTSEGSQMQVKPIHVFVIIGMCVAVALLLSWVGMGPPNKPHPF